MAETTAESSPGAGGPATGLAAAGWRSTIGNGAAGAAATDGRPMDGRGANGGYEEGLATDCLAAGIVTRLARLTAGRRLVWIAGNHDPGPLALPGIHRAEWREGPLVFRHIAKPSAAPGEVSAHYHPKARLRLRGQPIARPCFLADAARLILPAFGTYTGGLDIRDAAFDRLMQPGATAYLIGQSTIPLPRRALLRA